MSRRGRALIFGLAAIACAGIAASIAGGYRKDVAQQFGDLRPVVVATKPLDAGKTIGPEQLQGAVTVRRVPTRFVPPGSLHRPTEALGLAPRAVVPAGAYVIGAQLAPPAPRDPGPARLQGGRRAVEIRVQGAAALELSGPIEGARVDVVVADQPGASGTGRTYLAATGVRLLALSRPEGAGSDGSWGATLALTRDQAIKLIAAANYAREVRLLPAA